VIAEGVETEAQAVALTEIGCEVAQGFGLARPAPAEAIESLFSL
jgi:EAL domain-containing protein (putative c-di-GMP-specific phosphodiesterase class I)